jgi:AcrR family transcriptional regulator
MSSAKRQKIVSAALEVFFKYGYKRVSMNEIAEAAGISRPGLYLHFDSKEEVFRAAIVQFADGLIEEISKGIQSRKTIEEKIFYAFEVWAVRGFELDLRSPEAKEIRDSSYQFAQESLEQSYKKLESVLASVLKGHVRSRGNKKAPSPEKLAHILTSSVRGFKLSAKNATELRILIQELLAVILAA